MKRAALSLAVILVAGCGKSDEGESAASSQASAVARSSMSVSVDGTTWATLEPYEGGYRVRGPDGDKLGKVGVQDDRVKFKDASDATRAKVKVKDYGFKVYSDDETEIAKVKRKGAGFKVSPPEGDAWGELATDGGSGSLGGEPVSVTDEGGTLSVRRGDTVMGTVPASVGVKAASFLALRELSVEQRVAAMVFVQEKMQ